MSSIHPPSPSPTPCGPSSSACDVLIVEDDVLQAEELAAFLSRSGLQVEILHDGSTGLHRAATAKPRIALLDYNMPGLDGAQVAQRIRSVSPGTAVIMISGRIRRPSDATLGELGVSAFLNKPLSLSSLRLLIVKLIRTTGRTGKKPVAPLPGIATSSAESLPPKRDPRQAASGQEGLYGGTGAANADRSQSVLARRWH